MLMYEIIIKLFGFRLVVTAFSNNFADILKLSASWLNLVQLISTAFMESQCDRKFTRRK